MSGMILVMTLGAVALVVLAVVGVAAAWGLSRAMDLANQKRQTQFALGWLKKVQQDPLATAVYYGLRWLGICILIGWLFSRSV
ncbi:MAG: hypothetical protein FKY71_19875 [Spiribacter salinus]|uniref:Uncharacterized protein n=1 Tax=Spiribacter salinus TaxID=1335746 RepID=A0A540V6Y9_9GAMM|nr:MAG: hypothetical protein FKY71_19875 [Spiribacter salinus]